MLHTSLISPDLIRVTHARPLNPKGMAFVPFGVVLVRIRVRKQFSDENLIFEGAASDPAIVKVPTPLSGSQAARSRRSFFDLKD